MVVKSIFLSLLVERTKESRPEEQEKKKEDYFGSCHRKIQIHVPVSGYSTSAGSHDATRILLSSALSELGLF